MSRTVGEASSSSLPLRGLAVCMYKADLLHAFLFSPQSNVFRCLAATNHAAPAHRICQMQTCGIRTALDVSQGSHHSVVPFTQQEF